MTVVIMERSVLARVMEFLQYSIYLLVFVQLFRVIRGQSIGTPNNATVCDGRTTTLTCDISQSNGDIPLWRVFTTSNTSGSPVAALASGENSPPYNYPTVQGGDTVARLEVTANSSIDGYHFQCRLSLIPAVDSPGTGTITVRDTPSCPTNCTRSRNEDFTTVSVTWQQPPNTPPVTSTTVTYCPTSSPNCGNMTCTTSPCTISGLNACEDYQLMIVPANNCGSPTGCTGNSVMSEGQDTPSCPTNCTRSRNEDFTTISVSCQQPPNTPPVTFTTVTYCPTSSPNCGNSMNCTNSPCTISELDPCVNYNLSAIPNNNCGSPMGCTGNSVVSEGQDEPSCPTGVQVENVDSFDCLVSLTWQQPPTTPPVTSTTVTYCPTSSPNCGNSVTCSTNPCNISGLANGTEYNFTVFPNNICGRPTGCTGNITRTPDSCMPTTTSTSTTTPPDMGGIVGGVVGGLAGLAIAALATYAIAVLIAVLCCTSCEGRSYCHVFFCQYCCGGETKNSTRPMSADEYTDFKKVEEEKEKEDKITYATLEFSEKAGSTGENTIRSKEEPVQYLSVGQA